MELATLDRDLDALAPGLDVAAVVRGAIERTGGVVSDLAAVDAELAALGVPGALPSSPELPSHLASASSASMPFTEYEASTAALVPLVEARGEVTAPSSAAPTTTFEASPAAETASEPSVEPWTKAGLDAHGEPALATGTALGAERAEADGLPARGESALGAESVPDAERAEAARSASLLEPGLAFGHGLTALEPVELSSDSVEPAPALASWPAAEPGTEGDSGFDADALFADAFPAEAEAAAPPAEVVLDADFPLGGHEGPRFSVPDDLAALLEGELDPSEFGPARPNRPAEVSLADALESDSGTSPSLPPHAVRGAASGASADGSGFSFAAAVEPVHVDATLDPTAFDDEPATSVANLADFFAAEAQPVVHARPPRDFAPPGSAADAHASAVSAERFDDDTGGLPRVAHEADALAAPVAVPGEEEFLVEDGELEMFVEDEEMAEATSANETVSQAPPASPSRPPTDGKKGFFRKIFGG